MLPSTSLWQQCQTPTLHAQATEENASHRQASAQELAAAHGADEEAYEKWYTPCCCCLLLALAAWDEKCCDCPPLRAALLSEVEMAQCEECEHVGPNFASYRCRQAIASIDPARAGSWTLTCSKTSRPVVDRLRRRRCRLEYGCCSWSPACSVHADSVSRSSR
jgi:hypothetical protein